MNITITIPAKPAKGETISLKEAAAALGLTRQAAFHAVRKGTFPVATTLNGTRVRVDIVGLRKALAMKATATTITVPEAEKRARRSPSAVVAVEAITPAPAAKKATAKKSPAKKATKAPVKRALNVVK
jgi:hypothetical protein